MNKNDGVVIYLRDNINYTHELINLGSTSAIHLSVKLGKADVSLLTVYRSPSLCPFEFNRELREFLENWRKRGKLNVLVGDINIDILKNTDVASRISKYFD